MGGEQVSVECSHRIQLGEPDLDVEPAGWASLGFDGRTVRGGDRFDDAESQPKPPALLGRSPSNRSKGS